MVAFSGKVALVTGGATGIGRALCELLAAAGARLMLVARDEARINEFAAALRRSGGTAQGHRADVSAADQAAAAAEATLSTFGRIDFLFNNAGVGFLGEVRDLNVRHWKSVLDVNLLGPIHCIHAAYPHMVAQRSGHIVNISSLNALVPMPGTTPYSASKNALLGLSLALRHEAAHHGVNVSVACPGLVATDITEASEYVGVAPERFKEEFKRRGESPQRCARGILKGVRRNQAIITPSSAWPLAVAARYFPPLTGALRRYFARQVMAMRLPEDLQREQARNK